MSETTEKLETKLETVDINIDEIFNGAASAESITLPSEETKQNIFQKSIPDVDMSFTVFATHFILVLSVVSHFSSSP